MNLYTYNFQMKFCDLSLILWEQVSFDFILKNRTMYI